MRNAAILSALLLATACVTTGERQAEFVATMHGPITHETVAPVVAAINASNADVVVLDLEGPGGYAPAGWKIVEALDRARSRSRIVTRIKPGAKCHSLCAALFAVGDDRECGADSELMFHHGHPGRPEDIPEKTVIDRKAERFFTDHLRNRGIDSRWLDRLLQSRDFYTAAGLKMTCEQLANVGSNYPTEIIAQ